MFICVISVLFLTGICLAAEPTCSCSPFEYEEKLLAKMIRQEFIFEKLKENTEALENKVINKLEKLEREQEAYRNEVKGEIEALRNEVTSEVANSAKQMQRFTEEFQKRKDVVDEDSVAFFSKDISEVSLSSGQKFVFEKTVMNEGNGYDELTGQFTVPAGGLYQFNVQLCLSRGSSVYVYYDILVNNIRVQSGFFRDFQTSKCYTADVLIRLKTGDNVNVVCDNCSGSLWQDINAWNTFSGIRIHA